LQHKFFSVHVPNICHCFNLISGFTGRNGAFFSFYPIKSNQMPPRSRSAGNSPQPNLFASSAPAASSGGSAGDMSNAPEWSVSDISSHLKRTIESAFSHVRVRGEISQPKIAGSGHCYLRLKDEKAVLDGIIWRGVMGKLGFRPEEGMEVIATGKLSSYPGRSSYQMIIERMEIAGAGALLKILEDRKRALAKEGLFTAERKVPIPFLPRCIGVVTSPTGAVIRDILHRLQDRFPRPVLLWPVRVQGDGAAAEIAAAIDGFGRLPPCPDGMHPENGLFRPDTLIVARGGGSLEDLWAFNEECVVRAVANCPIPIISAVGHETDTTLIDYAADLRAPTPTGAAEKAVPVKMDVRHTVQDLNSRMTHSMARHITDRQVYVDGLRRGLPDPAQLLADNEQRLDDRAERLANALPALLHTKAMGLQSCAARIKTPQDLITLQASTLQRLHRAMETAQHTLFTQKTAAFASAHGRLRPHHIHTQSHYLERNLATARTALQRAMQSYLDHADSTTQQTGKLLDSYSFKKILARGFALVRSADGHTITSAKATTTGAHLNITFQDGDIAATVTSQPQPQASSGSESIPPDAQATNESSQDAPSSDTANSDTAAPQLDLF
jgi:exodeoxyribonuclease VII large subunit